MRACAPGALQGPYSHSRLAFKKRATLLQSSTKVIVMREMHREIVCVLQANPITHAVAMFRSVGTLAQTVTVKSF
jgi:hypothetical protein